MAKVLVTGGAGFIGSHVAEGLLAEGHQVVVLDDLSGGFRENVPAAAAFVEGSVLDTARLEKLFQKEKFEYVFHLAAYAAEGLSHFIKRFNYQNNLIGSVNLINLSILHHIKCFVFTSSIAVYGRNQTPMRESMRPEPDDPYGIAKFAVEEELRVSQAMFGLPYIIFRPHNVYGERQNIGDKYRNVVGIFMNQLMQNQPLTVFGDGSQKRAFSYIGDVAPVIARSIQNPRAYNQIFNIGADETWTVQALAEQVAAAFGVRPQIQHLEPRHEVQEAWADHSRVKEVFGSTPPMPLAGGLKKTAEWARQIGVRKTKKFEAIEIREKLPPSWES